MLEGQILNFPTSLVAGFSHVTLAWPMRQKWKSAKGFWEKFLILLKGRDIKENHLFLP